jgi:hypothetical protein|tara:strand:- start:233 stop:442 length:210 start_codon:yes stop_codon:yes gene_type:complete
MKITDKDRHVKNLERHIALLAEHSQILGELVEQIEEDIPRETGSKHLWQMVDEVNDLLCGPTRAYVNQD